LLTFKPNGLSGISCSDGSYPQYPAPTYEEMLHEQIQDVVAKKGKGDIAKSFAALKLGKSSKATLFC